MSTANDRNTTQDNTIKAAKSTVVACNDKASPRESGVTHNGKPTDCIIFCGGGTGGHITPAIAMAQIIEKYSDMPPRTVFIGRTGGAENAAIERAGYELLTLDVEGIRRSLSPKNLRALSKAIKARTEAKRIISELSPTLVVGTGGYVSWPVLSAAAAAGIPTVIHESNAYPGLVTRLMCKKCTSVLLGSADAAGYLRTRKNAFVVGNPTILPKNIISKEQARRRLGIKSTELFILSYGGSLGAARLNDTVCEMMRLNGGHRKGITHWHASGRGDYRRVRSMMPQPMPSDGSLRLLPYIEDMPTFLQAADLVIARSGAMTLSELAAYGVPAILIPSPNVAADHQYANAASARKKGGAIIIEESRLTADALYKAITEITSDKKLLRNMAQGMRSMHDEETPKRIYTALRAAMKKGEKQARFEFSAKDYL